MAHHFVHPGTLTPAARRAAARVRAQLPFTLYCAGTVGAMVYLLLLTCRAAG